VSGLEDHYGRIIETLTMIQNAARAVELRVALDRIAVLEART
jgi:hypothetical protein